MNFRNAKRGWGLQVLGTGLLVGCLLSSCSQPLNESEYRAYLQDPAHGLSQEVQLGAATVRCTYRPTELLVAQELRSGGLAANKATLDSLRRSFAGKAYFSLELARAGAEIENQFVNDRALFTQAVGYLNAGIAADAFLSAPGRKPLAAAAASYPRLYGSTGRSSVLLVFNASGWEPAKGYDLIWNDRQFGLGTLRFAFTATALNKLPELNHSASFAH